MEAAAVIQTPAGNQVDIIKYQTSPARIRSQSELVVTTTNLPVQVYVATLISKHSLPLSCSIPNSPALRSAVCGLCTMHTARIPDMDVDVVITVEGVDMWRISVYISICIYV
jgi:hypothetical protein